MRKKREPQKRTDGLTHWDFHKAFLSVCEKQGVELIDFYNDPMLDPFDAQSMPDGLHMSEKACRHMAQVIAERIRKIV